MGIGLSAQGVNMNRLPGTFQYLLCLISYLHCLIVSFKIFLTLMESAAYQNECCITSPCCICYLNNVKLAAKKLAFTVCLLLYYPQVLVLFITLCIYFLANK